MKRIDYKVVTDRVEVHVIRDILEQSDTKPPETYLMVGPPGGLLARVEGADAEILMMLLCQLQQRQRTYHYAGPPSPGEIS